MGSTTCAVRLSGRQRDVLFLICKGFRNAEAARQLRLSERTIKGYVSQLVLIFDVTNRTELVGKIALENPLFNEFRFDTVLTERR